MSKKQTLQDYGILPNARREKESVVTFLERANWFQAMTKAVQKHSEMMQPWSAENYPDMEYTYPGAPGINDKPRDDFNANDLGASGVCVVSCYAPLYCTEDVECHLSLSQTPPGMDPREAMAHVQMGARELHAGGTWHPVEMDRVSLKSNLRESDRDQIIKDTNAGKRPANWAKRTASSSIFPIRVAAPVGGWAHWPEEQSDMLEVSVMDAAGNICKDKLSVFCREQSCCDKPDYVAMTFDDASTPDTIAKNSSITLYVQNGCPTYHWTVSGSGFSLALPETGGVTNTLTLANLNCGQSSRAAYATITVHDECGTNVSFVIRATDGTWTQINGWIPRCTYSGSDCQDCFRYSCYYPYPPCITSCGTYQGGMPLSYEYQGIYQWSWDHECICDIGVQVPKFCESGAVVDNTTVVPPSCQTPYCDVVYTKCYDVACGVNPNMGCFSGSGSKKQWTC